MDSSTKRRLLLGFITNWIGKLASSIIQFVQIPVFLHFWPTALYGEWMIVNSIPTYLSFTNSGFGSVAGNEMTMMVARDDREGALRVFQSCWWLIALICTTTIVLLSGALYYLRAARLLKLTHISEYDTKWIIFYLGVSVLFGQLEQLLQSAYRCIGRYPYGAFLKTLFSLGDFLQYTRSTYNMAEPFGIAAGAVGIAAAFTACVDSFGYVQLGRHFGRDFQTDILALNFARLRLTRWGQAVNIYDDPKLDRPDATPAEIQAAKDTLHHILQLFADTAKISKKYKLNTNAGDDPLHSRPMI